MDFFVESDWLFAHLDDPNVIILDVSYAPIRATKSKYDGQFIKSARVFDIDHFSDHRNPLPHMMPTVSDFQQKARLLGINAESTLICYDNQGIYSSPRAWWMFKTMGHEKAAVLNGGLPEWMEKGYPVEVKKDKDHAEGNFIASFDPQFVRSMDEVAENITKQTFQLVDARSSGRFNGTDPEPRPHLSSGHIPNSINLPFQEVLDGGRFRPKEELEMIFSKLDREKPLVFSCGSGLTACIILLAAEHVLGNEKAVYDGSWTEWASKKDNPTII